MKKRGFQILVVASVIVFILAVKLIFGQEQEVFQVAPQTASEKAWVDSLSEETRHGAWLLVTAHDAKIEKREEAERLNRRRVILWAGCSVFLIGVASFLVYKFG